jgi:hypothetical protein
MDTRLIKDGISSIKIVDRRLSSTKYKKYFYLFFFIPIPITPHYKSVWGDYYTKEELINDGYIVENNIVYLKPQIIFYMNNNKSYEREFDTIEECYKYLEEEGITKIPQIILK